jgi:hypothetical protein
MFRLLSRESDARIQSILQAGRRNSSTTRLPPRMMGTTEKTDISKETVILPDKPGAILVTPAPGTTRLR